MTRRSSRPSVLARNGLRLFTVVMNLSASSSTVYRIQKNLSFETKLTLDRTKARVQLLLLIIIIRVFITRGTAIQPFGWKGPLGIGIDIFSDGDRGSNTTNITHPHLQEHHHHHQ